jgi:hypothetical protein
VRINAIKEGLSGRWRLVGTDEELGAEDELFVENRWVRWSSFSFNEIISLGIKRSYNIRRKITF